MPCIHKFHPWLTLPENLVTWKVRTLIIGTFSPGWNELNNARWFYGRTTNNHLWQILPELHGESSLRHAPVENWVEFCARHAIAFSDLIESIPSADIDNPLHQKALIGDNYSDTSIIRQFPEKEIVWTDLNRILDSRPEIKHVYLTNTGGGVWGRKFQVAQDYAAQHPERNLQVTPLYTPGSGARFFVKSKGFKTTTDLIKFEWIKRGFLPVDPQN